MTGPKYVLFAGAVFALAVWGNARSDAQGAVTNTNVSVPTPMPRLSLPSAPVAVAVASTPRYSAVFAASLSDVPESAMSVLTPVNPGPQEPHDGQIYGAVNYGDVLRQEYEQVMITSRILNTRSDGSMRLGTKRIPGVDMGVSMGGGDVNLASHTIPGMTHAAAVAEAGFDISDAQHRFGVRVQGRAGYARQIMLAVPTIQTVTMVVEEKPSITAYWHF